MRTSVVAAVAVSVPAVLASGCAFVSMQSEQEAYQRVSVSHERAEISSATQLGTEPIEFVLTPETPHMLGVGGKAPYKVLRLPDRGTKYILAVSPLRPGSAPNGDHPRLSASLQIQYLDAKGDQLDARTVGPFTVLIGVGGKYSGAWYAATPDVAKYVVVHSDPRAMNRYAYECVRPRGRDGLPDGSRCVTYPGGPLMFERTEWIYGDVIVQAISQ